MLIYSFEKEFIGIDEEYLKIFGLSDLAAMQIEHKDFADFFVKQPGYVHNFKHVHWIDFIDCAESLEESKVMINIHAKSFTANISVTKIYLSQSPSSKSFVIKLNNLRQLSGDTGDAVLIDIEDEEPLMKAEKKVYTQAKAQATRRKETVIPKKVVAPQEVLIQDVEEESYKEESYAEASPAPIVEPDYDIPLEIDMGIDEEIEAIDTIEEEAVLPLDDYVFDPKVASDELGLPVDLIEEFIEDFIAQAREFEPLLYSALEQGDLEDVAMMSHKLKGVAGNLRIENAYDTLCIINDSKDISVLKRNMKLFYLIVAKLAGEEVKITAPVVVKKETPLPKVEVATPVEVAPPVEVDLGEDEDFILEFKDEDATELIPLDVDIEVEEELKKDVVVEYSKAVAASEIGLDIETFDELLEDYIQAAFVLLEAMKEAASQEDVDTCRKKASLLKNMSDSMYIKDLTSDLHTVASTSDKNSMRAAIENMNAIVTKISK